MSEQDPTHKHLGDLIKITAHLENITDQYKDGISLLRSAGYTVNSKLDNVERAVSELTDAFEGTQKAHTAEVARIYAFLDEERKDRREAIQKGTESVTSERDFIRQMIQEELGERRKDRKDNRSLAVQAAQEVWKVGGKFIVAAIAILFVALVMKLSGASLSDIVGIADK